MALILSCQALKVSDYNEGGHIEMDIKTMTVRDLLVRVK